MCRLATDRPRDLCRACERDLPWQRRACPACGQGEGYGPGGPARTRTRYTDCASSPESDPKQGPRQGPWPNGAIERVVAPLAHLGEAAWLAGQQKRRSGRICAHVLAELLGDAVLIAYESRPLPDLLVPVPLHRWRELRRGFNQAELLARALGARLGLPLQVRAIRRAIATPGQRGAGRRSRRRAMAHAFAPVARAAIDGQIALIDDVLTTGATAAAAARALRAAGAESVHLWTGTRALPGNG
ncbi:MAG: hypothetical protein AAF515_18945 [Pseudomonadota bacterium]